MVFSGRSCRKWTALSPAGRLCRFEWSSRQVSSTGRHTHPGDEIDYVVEGEGEWTVEGQANRKAKAGDSIIIPGGTVHEARNTGTAPL